MADNFADDVIIQMSHLKEITRNLDYHNLFFF